MGKFKIGEGLILENDVEVLDGVDDPTSGGGVEAPIGSLYLRTNGSTYHKTGAGNTDWTLIVDSSGASLEDGYQNTFMGKDSTGNVLPSYSSTHHIANDDSLETAAGKLDAEIGADPAANSRTNNPIVAGEDVNDNIEALDDAIGADSDVSNTNYISVDSTVMAKASDLDGALKTHADDTTNPHQTDLDAVVQQDGQTNGTITIQSGGAINVETGGAMTVVDAPTSDTDVANKLYVDNIAQGLHGKGSSRAATTAALVDAYTYNNGTLGVGATLTKNTNGAFPSQDDITLVQGDRVLIKNETGGNAPYNGIYVLTTVGDGGTPWQLTRATDNDEADEFAAAYTFVEEGTTQADNGYLCTTDEPITVGTTNITWVQFSGAGQVIAGAGLTKSGNTINVGDANKGVQVNADDLEIDASEIAGDGLKQNGVSSYLLDIEPADFAGNGLEDNGSDDLQVKPDATGGVNLATVISVTSNGVAVKIDDDTIGENGSNQLYVKAGSIGDTELDVTINAPKKFSADNQDASSGLTMDQVATASYCEAWWLVTVMSNATGTKREAYEVHALHDGSGSVDSTQYAKLKTGSSISGLSISVDVSGGNMRLRVTATENIDWRGTRIANAE